MDEIRADYDALEQIAGQFAAQSQAIQELLQNVKGSMDPLMGGGWIGEGSDAFYSEMEGVAIPATQRLQQAMDEACNVTRQIMQTIKQAEEDASAPFSAN